MNTFHPAIHDFIIIFGVVGIFLVFSILCIYLYEKNLQKTYKEYQKRKLYKTKY